MFFSGIITALVTPFSKEQLDKASFLKLLDKQVQEGVNQFVLASTTGESPVLTSEEIQSLCYWFREFEKEKSLSLKLILSAGSFSTRETIEKVKRAEDREVDGLLVVTPYYNKPSQKGLLLHFEKVANETSLPILLYNVPSRTACSFEVETIKILSQVKNIVGIKEASGNMEFFKKIKQSCSENFSLLSGDDVSCMNFFILGGNGAISAAANILPREFVGFFQDPKGKKNEFEMYKCFLKELFKETNPVGVKQILNKMKIIESPELRLPLVALRNKKLSDLFNNLNKV